LTEHSRLNRTIATARLLIGVMVVLIAVGSERAIPIGPPVVIALVAAVLSVGWILWARGGRRVGLLLGVEFAADVVLIAFLARFTGGLASPFRLLYLVPVISAAARLGSRAGNAIAVLAVLTYLGLIPTGHAPWSYLEQPGAFAEITVLVVSLLLVATLVGQISRRAAVGERDLADALSELSIAHLRMTNVIASIRSGITIVDAGGGVVSLNRGAEEILGMKAGSVVGRDYRVAFAEVPAFCERLASALEAGRPETRVEFFVRQPGGRSVPIGLTTSILKDDADVDRGVIAVFQDLTEARRLEERSRHEDRLAALGEFAAGLAHEIRNPLNAIKGSVDMLRESLTPSADDARLFDLVSREVDRLNRLLNDVLAFGRMESGDRESVRLDSLVAEVATIARNHQSFRPDITLEADGSGKVEGHVNPEQMKRVLLNLLINAFEAIEGAGRVRVHAVPKAAFQARGLEGDPDAEVALVVEDTGCGVSAERRAEIFQPFTTSKKGGTGLGLAIVDKIVRAHGGRIAVATEPGRGSRFVVYLPH
jgi:two-component system sensor histidine kinase PilS (NtrC family)